MNAQEIIKKFDLVPLPEEGGFFRETFRDQGLMTQSKPGYEGERNFSTCIYYLVTPDEFSGLHLVNSTEVFHFYAGDTVKMVQINEEGHLSEHFIGNSLEPNVWPQIVVGPNIWQGTKLVEGGSWALLGCTVAPGFNLDDFTPGFYQDLSLKYPEHKDLIKEYTHA